LNYGERVRILAGLCAVPPIGRLTSPAV